jgi:SAM-dependent methyltransferase
MTRVIWHELECGRYRQDLPLWHELAASCGAPVLDVGSGTGRVSLDLARSGIEVVALDRDAVLIDELRRRIGDLPVTSTVADARDFNLQRRFPLIIVPMQTIQLLGGADGRKRFLRCAREHLTDGGRLAISLTATEDLEEFEWAPGDPLPLPDVTEVDGIVYSSQPTAVRREGSGFLLERDRSTVDTRGGLESVIDQITLDILTLGDLDAEAGACGLTLQEQRVIDPTPEHVGSRVVIAGA